MIHHQCANCGKKYPHLLISHNGKWYCPGACKVGRGQKLVAFSESQLEQRIAAEPTKTLK
jgi:hypothetical protein